MRIFLLLATALFFSGCERQTVEHADAESTENELSAFDPASIDVPVSDPSNNQPAAFGAALDQNDVPLGESATLVVRAKIAEPWHIYSADGPTGVGRPTSFELTLPAGVTKAEEWSNPEAVVEESTLGPISYYHGDVRFWLKLHTSNDASIGPQQIQCKINYQSCTDEQCLPPSSKTIAIPLTITQ